MNKNKQHVPNPDLHYAVLTGDILDNVTSGIIVHGCNAQGVMGSGIAASIKARYPIAFRDYRNTYESQDYRLFMGQVILSKVSPTLYVANAITQEYFGRDDVRYVSYDAIDTAFDELYNLASRLSCEVHYPLIGAGLANGNWSVIEQIISARLNAKGILWTL